MKKVLLSLGVASLVAVSASATSLYKPCVACHGADGKMTQIPGTPIAGLDKAKIVEALHGYKDGTYGGAKKGMMKGQVAKLDDAKIEELAEYISGL
ncbi:MAG: c-type cytochrome [Arcobacter butzleri]|nr:c-type cytochrome [Arcobacteraceae bacterium]MDY0365615.1 c-type cytochrome [Arcobacteraceae bacterium]NLO17681.1 c-type cytochrome [Aliarcobacter butzleri]